MFNYKQLILLILDGFGTASIAEGNAISLANPPNLNYLADHFPKTTLQASGPTVGLPWGEKGNSEVGHLNIGAGRIVSQDLPRINKDISNGEFFRNPSFLSATAHVKKNHSRLHLVGLVSLGGVHSSQEHLFALLALAKYQGLIDVYIHVFTDGRDTPPKAALESLDMLYKKIMEFGVGKIASVTGRFYAMDRGGHFEITERTFRALVMGEGETSTSARQAILDCYARQIFDETIPPTVIIENNKPVAKISDGDAVIFFNFRQDRAVQLARAFMDPKFDKFSKPYNGLQNMLYVTMSLFDDALPALPAFPPIEIKNSLGEVLSIHKLSQFHMAETEKYAHVTSFFNGGVEAPWPMEEREIVTSPVSYEKRYEDVPEMSVHRLTDRIIEKLHGGTSFILSNFANPDVVGHTGNIEAATRAIASIDECIGRIWAVAKERNACLLITSDHGNVEEMLDRKTGLIRKEHSQNPVPFLLIAPGFELTSPQSQGYDYMASLVPEGVLSDIAPTVLELMNIPKPVEMTGISLLPILLKVNDSPNENQIF